jgi:hypothetical protein
LNGAAFTGDFSASVWFNAADLANPWPALLYEYNVFSLQVAGDSCGCGGPGNLIAYATYAPASFTWFVQREQRTPVNAFSQVVVTRKGTNVTMYWNSQVAASGQSTGLPPPIGQSLTIGQAEAETTPAYTAFHGIIDDVRIYDRALTATEVKSLYDYESVPQPAPSTNGLVAYYPLDGNANDGSGYGNDGSVHGAVAVPNRFGVADSAFSFDGTTSYITIPAAPGNDLTGPFTVSMWMNPSAGYGTPAGGNGGNVQVFGRWGGGGAGLASYQLGVTGDGRLFVALNDGAQTTLVYDITALSTNAWHSVVFKRDATSFKLFKDNLAVVVTNGMVQPQHSVYDLTLGREEGGQYAYYRGKLDDIRIYNRALSDADINTRYAQESAPDPAFLTNGLVAYYPFNGNANDGSGFGNDGSIHGAVLTTNRFGFKNKAYYFDGVSAYITTPLSGAAFAGDFSASVWFNAADLTNGFPSLLHEQNTPFYLSIAGDSCGCGGVGGQLIAYAGTGAAASFNWFMERGQRTPVNVFSQVVVTKKGTNVTMYWNAQIAALVQSTGLPLQTGQYLTIGREDVATTGAYTAFHGVIDDVRFYDRALSATEVKALYDYERVPEPNNPPTGIQLSGSAINQSAGTNAPVGTLATTDADSGDAHSYTLVSGSGDTDNASFNLSGAILRANDASALPARIYSVRIQTDDGKGGTYAGSFSIKVVDDVAPVFAAVGPQTVEERKQWTYTLSASDRDLPLSYRLASGPTNVTVNPVSGMVSWTPGEAEGGLGHYLVFEALDNGVPPLGTQVTVHVDVTKVNNPPTLAAMADVTIPEGSAWMRTAIGEDLDLPMQAITYTVAAGPVGLVVDGATGVMRWTPTEAQGPGTYPVTVRVADPGGLTAERTFTVKVSEVNQSPQLAAVPDALLVFGQTLNVILAGSDADVPAQTLSYRLVKGPTNAAVSVDGHVVWTPVRAQAPSTNTIQVAVDDGMAGATNSFKVVVVDLVTVVNGKDATGTVSTLPPVTVAIEQGRSGWLVFYSLDGKEPTASSFFYLAPFGLTSSATVWPVLFSPDFNESVMGLPVRVNVLKPQTLVVNGGQGLVHQGPGVAVAASAESGLPASLVVVSGPARLEGGLLVPMGGGVVTLRTVQAGDEVWAPVSLEVTRTVARAGQTVTWTAVPGTTFGGGSLTLQASASSGLAVTYAVVSGPGSVAGDVLTPSGAGTIVARATQVGNADFDPVQAETTVEVAKAGQSLSFAALGNRAFTTTGIPLVGNASSGLSVTFAVLAGPAVVAGSQLTLTGVGPVVVRAIQSGNGNYLAALPKDQSFTVTQGNQTLVFTGVGAKTFGDAPVSLTATSSAGLPVVFQVLSGPGGLAGDVLTLQGAGSIGLQASQAGDARYLPASAGQTVVVAKAPQNLTFAPLANAGYSTNAIPLAATASSGLPATFRVVGGAATVNGTQLLLSGVGPVSVAADQSGNTNYLAAASRTNSFTVVRGTQTISFTLIGDRILGSPPVTLTATSSAGLPIVYTVLAGPATIAGNTLTLLGEGTVTVRSLNPGSPLWLSAQADQSFAVQKLTTLFVSVSGGQAGSVSAAPLKGLYDPSESVTLTATAAAGFEFNGWSGDLVGTANPATLMMTANRSVAASFRDVGLPMLTLTSPTAGETGDERYALRGQTTDNVGVKTLRWRRNGGAWEDLAPGSDGNFAVEGRVLALGENRIEVEATDAAGNVATVTRAVTWTPLRVLSVGTPSEVQEGQQVVFALSLSSPGDVGGLTFGLDYDPAYLTDPQFAWGPVVGQSVNNVNLATPGTISGSFALPGTALASGTNLVATVSFRARSVPFALDAPMHPTIASLSSAVGAILGSGNYQKDGSVRINPRKLIGDNNANQRIDIGDAVVISRLQVGLELPRSWDVGLNDLNTSGTIDSGDVVRALRVAVGLDAAPAAAPLALAANGRRAAVSAMDLTHSEGRNVVQTGGGGSANTNDVAALEFPDGAMATVGQPYRVVVRFTKLGGPISGLNFTLTHPETLVLGDHTTGTLIPGDALPIWNTGVGTVTLAAIRATVWPTTNGVAAVLTFIPTGGFTAQAKWSLGLSPVEVTGSGFDIRSLDSVATDVYSVTPPPVAPVMGFSPRVADGSFSLEIRAAMGVDVVVQSSTNLTVWTLVQHVSGQGGATPVKVVVQPAPADRSRFYRAVIP